MSSDLLYIFRKVYATGWCSHSARGLIADSQQQAYAVADQLADDWLDGRLSPISGDGDNAATKERPVEQLLNARNVPYISWYIYSMFTCLSILLTIKFFDHIYDS